ncbi:MAG: cation:proton antiporter [Bryobacterales bacterium]|nr:cation:proton antiporter [Bryobacterales bacterium]
MLVVFAGAKLMGELAEFIGQSAVVGEILAGILLGPAVLGIVQPSVVLSALAELGAMFLLFRIGLEVESEALLRTGKTAVLVAMLGVLLPFATGFLLMHAWGRSTVEALFLGAAMVATSVGITAQVLDSLGVLQHTASRTVMAAAVIDDVLGLIVLALVSSLAKGDFRPLDLALTAFMAIGFTVAVVFYGSKTMQRLKLWVQNFLRGKESDFHLAMVMLLGMGLLSLQAGVAAIIGAFLAGMALSGTVSHRVHDLSSGLSEFLVPFFLVGIGLYFRPAAISSPEALALVAIVAVAAVLSKMLGCGLGAWSLGPADRFRVGAGMVPRGEVGMVVAQIGMGLGAVTDMLYGVVVSMSLLTTIVAPPLLKAAFAKRTINS